MIGKEGRTEGAMSRAGSSSNMARLLVRTGEETPMEEARRRREIRRYFDKADKNKDGKLSKEEWHRVLNSSGVPTSREEVEEFFNFMDRDYDGNLSFEEFMGEESTIERLFKSMDKNGDGTVSREEFQEMCNNLSPEEVKAAFQRFDRNGDDRLNYREFCHMIHMRSFEKENGMGSGGTD